MAAQGEVVKHKQVVLAAYPKGMVQETDLRVEETQTALGVRPGPMTWLSSSSTSPPIRTIGSL
jgi:hypothetical protein